jgi:hypothetical protein
VKDEILLLLSFNIQHSSFIILLMSRRTILLLFSLFFLLPASLSAGKLERISNKEFPALIERLSEDPGFFDSDNLVSNEASYLQVFGMLDKLSVRDGVYLGVGPDQNFSYIAKMRPRLAILVDIRRQNMIYHLMFKALFDVSKNRAEYLANLFCKPLPRKTALSSRSSIAELVFHLERISPSEALFRKNLAGIEQRIRNDYQFPLTASDSKSVREIYREFFDQQFEIRFRSFGRPSFRFYPSLKELLLERDREGNWGNYLNSEKDFQFIKELHSTNRIIPAVGDFAGPKALRSIASYLKELGETLTVFYVSNVEYYLMQNDVFEKFGENVRQLPITDNSVFIRAYFRFPHPERRPGYISATVLQRVRSFLRLLDAGRYHTYQDLGLQDFLGNE